MEAVWSEAHSQGRRHCSPARFRRWRRQPKVESKAAPAAAEAEVIALEQAMWAATVRGDVAATNDAIGNPHVAFVTSAGVGAWTPEITARTFAACGRIRGSDYRTSSAGRDVIILTYEAKADMRCGERTSASAFHAMTVYQRRDGRWRSVAASQTPIAPATSAAAPYLTSEARAAIETQVRRAVEAISAAAKVTDAEVIMPSIVRATVSTPSR